MSGQAVDPRGAIEDTLARIAWAVSTGDRAAFLACHADDACWTDANGGRATPGAWFDAWRASPVAPGHQLWMDNVLVQFDGPGRAVASADLMTPYFGQTMVPATLVLSLTRVEDVYREVEGSWRLASRHVHGWTMPADDAMATAVRAAAPTPPAAWQVPAAADRIAILDLYADYAWALDTGDVDGFIALLAPDVVMSDPGGHYSGHGQVRAFLDELHGHNHSFPGRQHWISTPWLRQTGADQVEADVFVCVPATFANGAINLDIVGCYRDVLVRAGDRWRFRQRLILPWSGDLLAGFGRYAPVEAVR